MGEDDPIRVNPGYAAGQLANALKTAQEHDDAATRERAEGRVSRWVQVLRGLFGGELDPGSRTPVKDTPAWVTLEVEKGGFATGNLLAGGELLPHEQALVERLGVARDGGERARIADHLLSQEGLLELSELLRSGCYRIEQPEEGALLAVCWLLERGEVEAARDVVRAIAPWLHRLRFGPRPAERPQIEGTVVQLRSVQQVLDDLAAVRVPTAILRQREAWLVWSPLLDRAVGLTAATVGGELPRLVVRDGRPVRDAVGRFAVEGDWPLQVTPDGWEAEARALLDDFDAALEQNTLCGKPRRSHENLPRLMLILRRRLEGELTGRDVAMARLILATIAWKRGLPGSERLGRLRQRQARDAALPTADALARVQAARLGAADGEGPHDASALSAPVSVDEATEGSPPGTPMPGSLVRKASRCLAAPPLELIEAGVIRSGDTLADLLPGLTAGVTAAGLPDPASRRLYRALYRAFRRRRTLLLLGLKSQVRIEELPWVAALDGCREPGDDDRSRAGQILRELVTLTLGAFPHRLLPSKLLWEAMALAKRAKLDLPVTEELATDIFADAFTPKFVRAAQVTARRVVGTPYERYYGLPIARILGFDDRGRRGVADPGFHRLCCELAGEKRSLAGWEVVRSGRIIEQAQILTSHNLAVVFDAFDLARDEAWVADLVRRCFAWICRQHQHLRTGWRSRLKMLKNTAYTWRQMVFFLSMLPSHCQHDLCDDLVLMLAEPGGELEARFEPALEALRAAVQGGRIPPERRFLGWTRGEHWLAPPK